MSQSSHIGTGADLSLESNDLPSHTQHLETFDLDRNRLQLRRLALARQLVGRDACDLLRGEWWRHLVDLSQEEFDSLSHPLQRNIHRSRFAGRFTCRVITVGRESQPDFAFISFIGFIEKLGQSRISPNKE